jgi:hypothetical protein
MAATALMTSYPICVVYRPHPKSLPLLLNMLLCSGCKQTAPSRKARDPEAARNLWGLSAKLVGLEDWDPFSADDTTPPSWVTQ